MALYIALSVGPFIPSAFRNLFSEELTRIHIKSQVTNFIIKLDHPFYYCSCCLYYLIYVYIKPFGEHEMSDPRMRIFYD